MTRIDPGDIARRAEELRRRAEERARERPPNPAASSAPPQQERPAPADLLEKLPRLFGREIPMDFPIPPGMPVESPPPDLVPPPVVTPPDPEPASGPRTDVLPRLASANAQARLEADLDRQELAAVLGGVAAPEVAAAPVGSGFVATARPLVGVKRLDWAEKAPGLLKGRLAKLAEKAGSLEGRAVRIKDVLGASESRRARTVVGFDMAAGSLEKAAWKAGVARELAKLAPGDPAASLDRMTAARQQFAEVQAHAGEAEAVLRQLAPTAPETPWALQELRAFQQEAGGARWEAAQTEATGELLAEMDAGSGLLTEAPPEAGDEGAVPGAEFEFGEADLARIGSALDRRQPSGQLSWSEQMINTVCELGRQQGGVTDEQGGRNFELARTVLASAGGTGPAPLAAGDLAAVLKMAGVDLARVDPGQLQSAARYVSGAATLEDQQQKLRKTLDSFQTLEKIGAPRLTRQQMIDELAAVAKVPRDATKKLSDADLQKKFQEVMAAVNGGPGKSEIKIGKHKLSLTVGENGQVKKATCKKPGFFSRVWSAVKVVAPIALTIASFIPVTAPFARAAQGVISLVQGIKAKSLLGIATAGAAIVGAGSAIARGASQVVGTVERVANSVASVLQGVSSVRSGNWIGGIANIGGGLANGIAGFAGEGANRLGRIADRLSHVSSKMSAVGAGVASIDGYRKASQAVAQAKEALEAAQASGNPRAIADAQKRLSQAETQKRAALVGGAAGALSAASAWSDNRSLFEGQSKQIPPATAQRQFNLRLGSQALGVVQGVVGKDFASAAVSALSVGATLKNAPQKGTDPPPRGQSAHRFNDAANMAQAGLGYYKAEQARKAANDAVTDARSRLDAAKRTGDPEAIREAEAALRQARAGAESALMGGIAAGESLLATARDIGVQHQARVESTRVKESVDNAERERAALDATAKDEKLPESQRRAAREAVNALDRASAEFGEALKAAAGDAGKVKAARERYERDRAAVASAMEAATAARAPDSLAPAAAPPGLASIRRPSRIDAYKVTKDLTTIWEVSQLTGVSVERIKEFNEQSGNPLKERALQEGQQILVPMDPEDVKFKPKTPTEVRAMQRQAVAAQRAAAASGATGTLSARDAAPFTQIQQQFKDGNWQQGAASLAGLIMQGTPEQKTLARQLLGQIEQEQLRNVHLVNSGKIQQINEAVNPSSQGGFGQFLSDAGTLAKDIASMYLSLGASSTSVRTIADERMATIHQQDRAVSAVQQIHRETGMTLYELGRVPPAEMETTLRRVYPALSAHDITTLRGDVTKALANPDVGAISRANYSGFSWDRGLTQADTSFADSILQTTSKAIGSTLRQARSDAEVYSKSPDWWTSFGASWSANTLDDFSNANRFLTSTVETAKTHYSDLGGVTGWVGGAVTKGVDFLLPVLTAPLTIADHRATDEQRNRALVEAGLFVAGGALIRAAAPTVVRGLSRAGNWVVKGGLGEGAAARAAAMGAAAARLGRIGRMSIGDATWNVSNAILRQGTRAAEAMAGKPMGRTIALANQRVLAPLTRFSTGAADTLGRTADLAKDYFSLVNRFTKGPVMQTGARNLTRTGVAEVQARHEARKAYDAIRRSTDDVAQIAKTTGRSEAEIAQIKNHIFVDEHQLATRFGRLDPHPEIAAAWGRLRAGSHTSQDLAFLQHEIDESMLMKAGMSQHDAHAMAGALEGTSSGKGADTMLIGQRARFGESASGNYRETFFAANPETRGRVWVHHAVERQVARDFPELVSQSQIHSLENLRGIPTGVNGEIHLSQIRKSWNRFYKTNPTITVEQLLDHATQIDDLLGHLFTPRIR